MTWHAPVVRIIGNVASACNAAGDNPCDVQRKHLGPAG
jgi:hypothetical protein